MSGVKDAKTAPMVEMHGLPAWRPPMSMPTSAQATSAHSVPVDIDTVKPPTTHFTGSPGANEKWEYDGLVSNEPAIMTITKHESSQKETEHVTSTLSVTTCALATATATAGAVALESMVTSVVDGKDVKEPVAAVATTAPKAHRAHSTADVWFRQLKFKKRLCDALLGSINLYRDDWCKRDVVIKESLKEKMVMSMNVFDDPRVEIEVHKAIGKHPNIVSLIAVHVDDKKYQLAMPYYPLVDLHEIYFKTDRWLTIAEIQVIMSQILAALMHLARHGYANLDISMENLAVLHEGSADDPFGWHIVLIDLASCIKTNLTAEQFVHCMPVRPGKSGYLSPEVEAYTRAYKSGLARQVWALLETAVWSLGVILHQMLYRGAPYENVTDAHARRFINRSWPHTHQTYWNVRDRSWTGLVSDMLAPLSHRISFAKLWAHPLLQAPTKSAAASVTNGQSSTLSIRHHRRVSSAPPMLCHHH